MVEVTDRTTEFEVKFTTALDENELGVAVNTIDEAERICKFGMRIETNPPLEIDPTVVKEMKGWASTPAIKVT